MTHSPQHGTVRRRASRWHQPIPAAARVLAAITALLFVLCVGDAGAQPARPGTLQVTVVDPTGAVIANATVTVTAVEPVGAAAPMPASTSDQGVATFTGLAPGRYAVQAEFPGFETRRLPDVRVRAGDNRQVLLLPIAGLEDTVTVGRGTQEAAADRQGTFGTTLTREQMEALSDDPDVLQRQLQDMAGPGAIIKVDSFEGGALPPKAQIRSIRIARDQFAAENHSAGGTFIEIITQPGQGPIRYNSGFRFRSGSLSGRSPFTPVRGSEQIKMYMLNLNGALVPNRASFNLNVQGQDMFETPNINAATLGGTRAEALRLRTPRDNRFVNANLDYAVSLNHTLRFGFNSADQSARNLGIGEYDFEERAYETENTTRTFRAQHLGPLGRRMFTRSRLQLHWTDSSTTSATEAPTIRVLDAFTRGGAQLAGGQHVRGFTAASDLDYVRGVHSYRVGLQVDGLSVRADDVANYLGTYTFESRQAFEEGRPRSYTRRLGDPSIAYRNTQAAIYVQDDIRVRRNLTLSPGVRYEAQSLVKDYDNVMPRMGITWAPFASGATTLRSSWGVFHDWMPAATYEQTLRVDGIHQQEVDIRNPSYPDVGGLGAAPPANRYLLSPGLQLPRTTRVSAGIDQRLTRAFQSSVTYAYQRGGALYRGLNLNPPVDGQRPDPAFNNVVEVVSDASSRQHQAQFSLTANPGALLPAFNAPRVDFKRVGTFVNYTLARLQNDTDGAFAVPATGSLLREWGAAPQDIRHRFNVTVNNQIVRNLLGQVNFSLNGGAPYTVRTGLDGNADLIFNDRPAGVARGTGRAATQWTINPAAAYTFTFGRTQTRLPPGIAVVGGGAGGPTVQTFDQNAARYRLQLIVQIQNVTNRPNYVGYSGVLTSPFFGRPTAVAGTRKVDISAQFSF